MGVIDVVNKYLSLVKKSENRVRIVRDPKTLPTLSVFLQNGDGAVVSKTIEVLELLSQEPQVHAAMREEPSLLTQVAAVVAKYKASLASTSSTASDVVLPTVISPSSAPDAAATPAATPSSDAASTYAATILLGEKIAENLAASSALQASKSESGAACAFTTPVKPVVETIVIPAVVKTEAKVVEPVLNHVLFVKGLFGEEQREKIENALLATTGVLSFWFDIHQQKAEIRARIDEKSVIAAIKTSGFTAIAWRGEGSPHAAVKTDASMINQTAPKPIDDNSGYLDEKENIQHSYGSGGWLGTLSLFGSKTPANKKKDAQPTPSKGLFGAIKSSWW